MSEQVPTASAAEQTPTPPVDILSSNKVLAHWQLDHEIADAVATNAPATTVAVLKFKKSIIDSAYMVPGAIGSHGFYQDPAVLKRVKDFKETHDVQEDLDPLSVRTELAMKARWTLSGRNPDDYSPRDREYIERDLSDMAARQREIEKLVALQTRDYGRLNETLADIEQSAPADGTTPPTL